MEVSKEIKPYQVSYLCPRCEEGYMKPTGVAYLTNPARYPHICDKPGCDNQMTFNKQYPYVEYR